MNLYEVWGDNPYASFYFIKRSIIQSLKEALKPTKTKLTTIAVVKSVADQTTHTNNRWSFMDFINPLPWFYGCIKNCISYFTPIIQLSIVLLFVYFLFVKGNKLTTLIKIDGIYNFLSKITLIASSMMFFGQNLAGLIISGVSLLSLFIINQDLLEISSYTSILAIFFNISYCALTSLAPRKSNLKF